jgi:class 3 adenylate cyclase
MVAWATPVERAGASIRLPWLAGFALLLLGFVAALLGVVFHDPILELARVAEAVERGEYPSATHVEGGDEIGFLGEAFAEMVAGLRHRDELSHFVSDDVRVAVRADMGSELAPGGELQEVTVLFASLRGFKEWAAKASHEEIVTVLGVLLDTGGEVFRAQGGNLDKIVEDTLMAVFRPSRDLDPAAIRAVRAAFRLQEALREKFSALRANGAGTVLVAENTPPFFAALPCAIGIASGKALSGCIGSPRKLDFSVIGRSVNLAARLKAQAWKAERTGILVAPGTIREMSGSAKIRFLERTAIKGLIRPVSLYEFVELRLCSLKK